jgi:hypothetical protein
MDVRVFRGETCQRSTESKPLIEIRRAVSAGLRIGEVGFCRTPRCLEQLLNFSEKSARQTIKWIGELASRTEQATEHSGFLSGDGHALSERRIKPAKRIAKWN